MPAQHATPSSRSVPSLAAVNGDVLVEMIRARKALVALVALEWLLSRVQSLVPRKLVRPRELPVALIALQGEAWVFNDEQLGVSECARVNATSKAREERYEHSKRRCHM